MPDAAAIWTAGGAIAAVAAAFFAWRSAVADEHSAAAAERSERFAHRGELQWLRQRVNEAIRVLQSQSDLNATLKAATDLTAIADESAREPALHQVLDELQEFVKGARTRAAAKGTVLEDQQTLLDLHHRAEQAFLKALS